MDRSESRIALGRRKLIRGTAWGVLGEGLALPTGLLTAAVLSRVFGPSGYGLYALAIGLVSLCQAGINFLLTFATIKFTSEADDPDPVARTVLRLHLLIGCMAGLGVAAAAPLVAEVLDEARLTAFIRVFSLSLPLETLAQGHVGLLIGLGRYRERAFVRAAHWAARFGLIVCLVLLGFGITGALVGAVSASAVALALARVWIRPSLRGPTLPLKPFLALGAPLLVAGMAGMARQRLDLFALKSLGASAAEAGLYAAAQTLAAVPFTLALALGPLVLSSLNRAWSAGDRAQAKKLARDLFRAGLWLLPLAGLVAGASSELMSLVYGVDFEPGAAVFSVLFVSSTTLFLVSTCGSVFIVTDEVKAMMAPSILGLLAAVILYPILIPAEGSLGAALCTLGGSAVGLTVSLSLVWRIWGVAPPPVTALRSLVITALAFWFTSVWPSSPVWLLPKLALGTGGILLAFLVLGEFRDSRRTDERTTGGAPKPVTGDDEPGGTERLAISVIVPTFARPGQLDDCLRSLAELDYPRDRFEVIVVDDGSPGPLEEILKPYGRVLDLRVLRQENQGPGAARNAGAAIARAQLLAFTDDDCRPERGWLRGLVEASRDDPNSMIGGRTVNGLTGDVYATASQIIVDVAYAHYNADAGNARFLASNNLAVPRDRFLDLGGFDPAFRIASEDRDLCDRWLHAGYHMVVAPKAVVVHRHHQSLIEFVGMHFRYGRGARRFHTARAARGSGNLLTEARFHARFLGLLPRRLQTLRWGTRLRVCPLLLLWQAANALGFLYEFVSGDRVRSGEARVGGGGVRRRDSH